MDQGLKKVAVFRKEHFNAAHRLNNAAWDDATNKEIFGKCNNPHYHGHNYDLIVRVTGVPEVETGYVMDTKKLSDLIKEKVLDKFDHKNLNPTAENIVIVIYNLLRPEIKAELDIQLRLYETERKFVEYPV